VPQVARPSFAADPVIRANLVLGYSNESWTPSSAIRALLLEVPSLRNYRSDPWLVHCERFGHPEVTAAKTQVPLESSPILEPVPIVTRLILSVLLYLLI
jgi:hypothetical protein